MIYDSYIKPNNVTTDTYFLRYEFTEAMLDALGILDNTGVIYELVNYRYFEEWMLGSWEAMIDGMINVSSLIISKLLIDLCLVGWHILHQSLYL